MAVNEVNGSNSDLYLPENSIRQPVQNLDKDAFLQIMIAQLRYQDPTSPTDSSKFIEQMATFTTLEQITNLNTSMEKLYTLQQFSSASALMGNEVTVYNGEEMLTGTVDRVTMSADGANLWVGGKPYFLEQVIAVEKEASDGSEELPASGEQQQTGDTSTAEATVGEETGTNIPTTE